MKQDATEVVLPEHGVSGLSETPLPDDRPPLPWAVDGAQEFCRKHVDAVHYELAWPVLANLLQVVDDSRLHIPGKDVPLCWRGSVSDLATDIRGALSAEQVRELARSLAPRTEGV